MGGLFSSNKKPSDIERQLRTPPPQIERHTSRAVYSTDPRYGGLTGISSTTYSKDWQDDFLDAYRYRRVVPRINEQSLCDDFTNLSIRPPYIKKVQVNKLLIKELAECVGVSDWCSKTNNGAFYTETVLNVMEYAAIAALFMNTNKKCFQVDQIEKVYNIYLYLHFKLKQLALTRKLRCPITQNLFHGTKARNIEGICNNNFNWRLRGTALGHRFGQGVSFTNISNYATHYGDLTSFNKVMILADVLISNKCVGNANMMIPDEPFDTATNNTQQVFVKFEDNEFYPCYVIHYHGFDKTRKR